MASSSNPAVGFIPSSYEQARWSEALNLTDVEWIVIKPDKKGDGKVEAEIAHSATGSQNQCVDHFSLTKTGPTSLSIEKKLCKEPPPHSVTREVLHVGDGPRWFSLLSIFLPDMQLPYVWPDAWVKVQNVVSNNTTNERMWLFANPRFDSVRKWLAVVGNKLEEGVVAAPAQMPGAAWPEEGRDLYEWQSFATFLEPLDPALQTIIDKWQKLPSLKAEAKVFDQLFDSVNASPPVEDLNPLLEKAFPQEAEGMLRGEVQSIVFSAYPLMSYEFLDGATTVVTAWVKKRLLFHVGASIQEEKAAGVSPGGDSAVSLTGSVGGGKVATLSIEAFQSRLTQALLNEKTTKDDVEEIRRNYQVAAWRVFAPQKLTSPLVTATTAGALHTALGIDFDKEIALPVLRKFVENEAVNSQAVVAERLSNLTGIELKNLISNNGWEKVEKPLDWGALNFLAASPFRSKFLPALTREEALAAEAAIVRTLDNLIEKITLAKTSVFLSAPSAFKIVEELRRLHEEGYPTEQGGAKTLSLELGQDIFQTLLDLQRDGFFEMEPEAAHALTFGFTDYPSLGAAGALAVIKPGAGVPEKEEEQKWYQKLFGSWWFWGGVVAVAGAAGGGIYLGTRGGGSSGPEMPPPTGNGNGNGNGNGMPPTMTTGDSRTKTGVDGP